MDVNTFLRSHASQLTAVVGLVTYGLARKKFTAGGVAAGILISVIHILHPWPAFFWLLTIFVFIGTLVTKIGHAQKAHLTQSPTAGGGEGPRTAAQVFANSGFACLLVVAHWLLLNSTPFISSSLPVWPGPYSPLLLRLLPIGIITQYAAVAADTCSSELGILAQTQPRLITAPWKQVPKGTNGGVTIKGLLYGGIGSVLLTLVAVLMFYSSAPKVTISISTALMIAIFGLLGSVVDSLLGALVQATVTDTKSGKVIEGPGGTRVKVTADGSRKMMGMDLLTNNGVNFAMAAITSVLAMGFALVLDLRLGGGL